MRQRVSGSDSGVEEYQTFEFLLHQCQKAADEGWFSSGDPNDINNVAFWALQVAESLPARSAPDAALAPESARAPEVTGVPALDARHG